MATINDLPPELLGAIGQHKVGAETMRLTLLRQCVAFDQDVVYRDVLFTAERVMSSGSCTVTMSTRTMDADAHEDGHPSAENTPFTVRREFTARASLPLLEDILFTGMHSEGFFVVDGGPLLVADLSCGGQRWARAHLEPYQAVETDRVAATRARLTTGQLAAMLRILCSNSM